MKSLFDKDVLAEVMRLIRSGKTPDKSRIAEILKSADQDGKNKPILHISILKEMQRKITSKYFEVTNGNQA